MSEVNVAGTPVFQSKYGFHPFDFPTLKKLREINKYYYWMMDRRWSEKYKMRKLPHNRFVYTKTPDGVKVTPWVQKEIPDVPNVQDIIEAGRHGKVRPEDVKPIRYSVEAIDAILKKAREDYRK